MSGGSGSIWGAGDGMKNAIRHWYKSLAGRELHAWQTATRGDYVIPVETSREAYDPSLDLSQLKSSQRFLRTQVLSRNPQADWETALQTSGVHMDIAKRDIGGLFSKRDRWSMNPGSQLRSDFSYAFMDAKGVANDGMYKILEHESTARDKVVDAEARGRIESELSQRHGETSAGEVAADGAGEAFNFSDTQFATVVSHVGRPAEVMGHASTQASLDAALGLTGSTSSPMPSRFFNSAEDTLKAAIGNILGDAEQTDLLDLFSSAFTQAKKVLDDDTTKDLISNMVTSFEDALTPQLNRAFNRFAGGMVDINAVEGSAFMIGMSNIERQNSQEVQKFHNQLTLEIFNSSYDKFLTSAMQMFQQYLEFYIREKLAYVGLYQQSMEKFVSTFSTLFTRHLDTYVKSYDTTLADIRDFAHKDLTLTSDYTSKSLTLLQQGLTELFKGHISSKLQAYAGEDATILSGISQITSNDYNRINALATDAETSYKTVLMKIERSVYFQNDKLRREKERRTWELDMMNKSSGIMVTGKASVPPGPVPPTQGEKALAGATTGALIGAEIGGGWGAIAGGVIGGGAGFFS